MRERQSSTCSWLDYLLNIFWISVLCIFKHFSLLFKHTHSLFSLFICSPITSLFQLCNPHTSIILFHMYTYKHISATQVHIYEYRIVYLTCVNYFFFLFWLWLPWDSFFFFLFWRENHPGSRLKKSLCSFHSFPVVLETIFFLLSDNLHIMTLTILACFTVYLNSNIFFFFAIKILLY